MTTRNRYFMVFYLFTIVIQVTSFSYSVLRISYFDLTQYEIRYRLSSFYPMYPVYFVYLFTFS